MNKNYICKTIVFVLITLSLGCAPTISYLPSDNKPRKPASSLKIYWEKPGEQYEVLGMIIGSGADYEEVFAGIKKKALLIGADAIIMKPPGQDTIPYEAPPFDPYYWYDTSHAMTVYRLEGLAVVLKKSPENK